MNISPEQETQLAKIARDMYAQSGDLLDASSALARIRTQIAQMEAQAAATGSTLIDTNSDTPSAVLARAFQEAFIFIGKGAENTAKLIMDISRGKVC